MNSIKIIAAVLLIMIAIVMIVIGIRNQILPPPLTGVGFLAIAIVFLNGNNKT